MIDLTIGADSVLRPRDDVIVEGLVDEIVLYCASTQELHVLDAVAAGVWDLLDGKGRCRRWQ